MSPLSGLVLCLLLAVQSCYAKTVRFQISVGWGTAAPDGFSRPTILVNGTSPGPALMVNQYDNVEFLVCNNLNDSTALHFHGIEQLNTPWSDGVAGLAQKPIPSKKEFLYKWTANEYGTYWYHSHYKSQVSDGFFGPIYVQPASSQARPFIQISSDKTAVAAMMKAEANPVLVTVADWSHVTSAQFMQIENNTNVDIICTNSILVNGKGRVDCLTPQQQKDYFAPPFQAVLNGPLKGQKLSPNGCLPLTKYIEGDYTFNTSALPPSILGCSATNAPLTDFPVSAGQGWVSFNFINAATLQAPVMSIDNHPMWVYAVDGRYVKPKKVDGLQFYNGERYSVMVQLNNTPGTYQMRAANFGLNQLISGFATMTYTGSSKRSLFGRETALSKRATKGTPYFTYGGFPVSSNVTQQNDTLTQPFENVPPSKTVDATHILKLGKFNAPWIWTLDGQESYPQLPIEYAENQPLLYYPNSMNANDGDLVIKTNNNTWVDIVIVSTDAIGPPHPMHKHSNKAYVIGSGVGEWKWNTVAEAAAAQPQNFNFVNPLLRDGYITPVASGQPTWLAIRYQSVNPGAWMLHCHIQTHLAGGMAVAILDGVDKLPRAPPEYGPNGNGITSNGLS